MSLAAIVILRRVPACRRVQLRTSCKAVPEEESAVTERGEGWKIEAEASPLQGDALEARLTEQVEEGTAGTNPEIAQTCESCSVHCAWLP